MAEYYPLLARAVAGLKTSTPQARRAIYERARGALLAQLRAMNPPIPEPDIQRESDALDAAIARLEAEHAASSAPEAEAEALRKAEEAAQAVRDAEARAAQDRAAREQEQAARAQAEAQARAAEEARAAEQARIEAEARKAAAAEKAAQEARAAEAARREEERLAAERAARQHAEQEARLAAEKRAREARERAAAEQAEARRRDEIERAQAADAAAGEPPAASASGTADGAAPGRRGPDESSATPAPAKPQGDGARPQGDGAKPAEGDGFFPAQARPGTLAVPVKPPASAPARPEPPPPPPAPDITVALPEPDAVAAPPIAIVAPQPAGIDRGDPFAAFAADRGATPETGFEAPELEGDARNKPSRPAAPLPPPERSSHLRHVLAGGALALALGGIGYAAWVLRDKAQELPRPKTAAETPAAKPAEAGGKIAERIGASPSAPVPTVQAPAQTIRPANAPMAEPPPPPPIAAPAQLAPARAAFLIQSDGAEQHKTYSGVVNWRVENGAWRADVSAPEVKLALSFVMTKSADGGPASHKIDLRFQFDDPAYQIGRIGAPELRKEENPYGDRLAAVAVPVTPNVYLIGLRRDEADVAYNLELIRSRGWIDIPIEMADKRIAKVTFEKGPAGEATFAQALKGW